MADVDPAPGTTGARFIAPPDPLFDVLSNNKGSHTPAGCVLPLLNHPVRLLLACEKMIAVVYAPTYAAWADEDDARAENMAICSRNVAMSNGFSRCASAPAL